MKRDETQTVLVTGCAGFIGFHVAQALLDRGARVLGVDDLNDYYDVRLKEARLARLSGRNGFDFVKLNVADRVGIETMFAARRITRVVHLAAQAGVRYSLTNPHAYADSNLTGFLNILEGCRHARVAHLVFASSSSVYGGNTRMPFSVRDAVDHPLSLYAATKKANELMAHAYASLYGFPCTGLRFFTVYGPWGRPDMALFLFTKAILEGRPIELFNDGAMQRDFTYIDDVVAGVLGVLDRPAQGEKAWNPEAPDPGSSRAPYRLYNIGNHRPEGLTRFLEVLEQALGRRAEIRRLPMQPGDVPATYAEVDDLVSDIGFKPDTPIEVGIPRFVRWYRDYYKA
ncbi:MAG TPA: NAD-dependent epimerase [Nitrospirales bacterium]|nr:NAD-dependent epimerase [Nitrospirales bacterium]